MHEESQQSLIRALRNPAVFPHAADNWQLIETHISWVILCGPYAYKIKKALNLGFLDFTTLEKRKFYCDEEVTVIVNWEKGVVRNIDFPSCIKFIETYYDQIDQKHLISYSRDMIIFGGSKNLKSVNLKIFIAVLKGNLKDLSFIIRLIYRYPRVMYLWSKFRGDIK